MSGGVVTVSVAAAVGQRQAVVGRVGRFWDVVGLSVYLRLQFNGISQKRELVKLSKLSRF